MEVERLELKVAARRAGLEIVEPPLLEGRSGTMHRFGFVARDQSSTFAFDFYNEVTEIELLRSAIKGIDTGAKVNVVTLSGETTETALLFASELKARILDTRNYIRAFEKQLIETTSD